MERRTDGWEDGRTDGLTNRVTYRVACALLKIFSHKPYRYLKEDYIETSLHSLNLDCIAAIVLICVQYWMIATLPLKRDHKLKQLIPT